MYRRWINVDVPPFIDPHWEARGDRLNGLCEAKMFIVRNEFRERRALGVAAKPWGGVKFRQRCWHDEGGPRLEASLQASSLIHTSAPLVSSLISGTESWRTLSSRLSHDFERFGEDRAVGRNLELFSPSSPLLTRGNRFLVELLTFVQRWSQTRIGKIFKGSKIMTEKSSSLYPLYPCKSASFVPLQSRNFLHCSLDKNR